MTEWRAAVGWEGFYEVADGGRVRSVDRIQVCADGRSRRFRGRSVTVRIDDRGYLRATLYRGGRATNVMVHALVAEAFIEPRPTPTSEVRHRDGRYGNCWASNLQWGSKSDNMRDAVEHGTHANAAKITCPEGHELRAPNLVPSKLPARQCLACSRGRSWAQCHPGVDWRPRAQDNYDKIMKAAA